MVFAVCVPVFCYLLISFVYCCFYWIFLLTEPDLIDCFVEEARISQ